MLVLTHTFIPFGDASKPTRNGIVHLMIPFIIATAFSCEDANELIYRMRTYRTTEEHKTEMIQIVKDSVLKQDVGTQKPTKGTD